MRRSITSSPIKKKVRFTTKGETLIETLIALTVLAIGLTISSLVISGALENMRTARDRVIATNMAREGMEAIRNIRDTNWLKFSNNRRACWNHFPGTTVISDTCNGTTPIVPGNYIVYKNDEFRWKLDDVDQGGEDATRLERMDIEEGVDSDLDGQMDNDLDMYNHSLTTNDDVLGTSIQSSIFQRTVTIEYLKNEPDPGNESIDNAAEWGALPDNTLVNRMRVTATVTWQEGGLDAVHTVQLKTVLTDYLGRSSLSG